MARQVHIRGVVGNFGGDRVATVTINRDAHLIRVRPARRRTVYELPLGAVAEVVVWQCVKEALRKKRAAKQAARRARAAGGAR